ncbi:uncharacterized protein LOC117782921 [Drosophila innubila]|uniref:uncharacterized protein LOC117782921 n=1 Tax=Drosophila innubila TaxID=198719 RepID=UPI00148CB497|nr:uncharacterized protein LOC117782921 [Drosophila innubila]
MFINLFVLQFTLVSQFYFVSLVNAQSQRDSITKFGNCSNLFGAPLKLQCTGLITTTLRRNYKDRYVIEGTPYAIFAPDSLMVSVFITMYSSPLLDCNTLTVINSNTFNCDANELITLRVSRLFCFNYPMRYFAELRNNCMKARNAAYNVIDHSALHYANDSNLAKSWSANSWVVFFITLMVFINMTLHLHFVNVVVGYLDI